MLALHFGAGNIGKGLIGYLLSQTGYEVCFVDIDQQMVSRFNKNKCYEFEILDDKQTVETVSPVSALNSITQEDEVIKAIVNADLITTSVGINNLSRIANVIAKGLLKRMKVNRQKLDIIANENAINASSALKREIEMRVSNSDMNEISRFVGFPNSAIDRLALSKKTENGEIALVEPFYEWIINKSEMIQRELPPIKNAIYVEDLQPYIERKLYIVNMGHAATAYLGFLAGEPTIQSALKNPEIENFVRGTLYEASQFIIRKYNIDSEDMSHFIDKTLKRFKNKNISDDLLRVGRSPIRKLGPDERLIKPTRELFKWGLSIKHLTGAVAAGFLFDNPLDEESVNIQEFIKENGVTKAVSHFTELDHKEIIDEIVGNYERFTKN